MLSNVIPLFQSAPVPVVTESREKLDTKGFDVITDHSVFFAGHQRADGFDVWGWGETIGEAVEHAAVRANG